MFKDKYGIECMVDFNPNYQVNFKQIFIPSLKK
jgi:hypothetical protein